MRWCWRSLGAGMVLFALFVWEELRSRAPMMPLGVFRSRTFSGVNALTLLLYAGLGGAFFFLPFLLIQVHGFSATLAGASFLPFTAIMAGLSRWAGGLIDRFGARLPLVIGPGDRGRRLRAARRDGYELVYQAACADDRARPRYGDHGRAAHYDSDQRGAGTPDRRCLRHQQCGGVACEPARGRDPRRGRARRLQSRTRSAPRGAITVGRGPAGRRTGTREIRS